MPATLPVPIRRLTLYKHGVAFVEREGVVEGEALALDFRGDEVNDALKSLLALDHGGGRVLGIAYATPVPGDERLADSPLRLSPDHSLLDLLRALRGHEVRLTAGEGSQARDVEGRLIGLDVARQRRRALDGSVTLLEGATGAVVALPLAGVRRVALLEERAAGDLRTLLDASRVEDSRRTLQVRLTPGRHELHISYVIPSSTWRVGYRIVAESAAEAASPGGMLLLQGWGLLDNRFGEDLTEVAVTLVAGQPISFRYDLATSRLPERPEVADAARVAPGPVEFAEALPPAPSEQAAPGWVTASAARAPMAAPPRAMRISPKLAQAYRLADPAIRALEASQASGVEQGELFAYEVTEPVTMRRGDSALVPILHATQPYRRLLLFNREKLPNHPVATLQFTNISGLVLERGPVTVLEDGAYHGEAIVPFTRNGGEVLLGYAVELGVTVNIEDTATTETAGICIARGLLQVQQANVQHSRFRMDNSLTTAQVVTIEARKRAGSELVETPEPAAQTAEHYRWTVTCPPRQATVFDVHQRSYQWQSQQVLDQSYEQLAEYLRRGWLDRETLERLRRLLEEQSAIARNAEERDRLFQERTRVYEREEQLRKNMAALGSGGAEGTFREAVVQQLQECESRVNAADARLAALQADTERREAIIQQELATIEVGGGPLS